MSSDIVVTKLQDATEYLTGTFRLAWNGIELSANIGGTMTADLPFNVAEDTLRQAVEALVDANGQRIFTGVRVWKHVSNIS